MDSLYYYRKTDPGSPGDGFLKGLKIALQPEISVKGWPSDAGSKALAGFTAVENATIVHRLRDAGAYLCGFTRMSEFGFGLGNSSAGESVKGNESDAEIAMDFMGESRLAASCAGVCGFKPSYGFVSRYGLIGLIPSMECCGVLSRSIDHIRNILKTIAGPDELDFSLPDEDTVDFRQKEVDPPSVKIGIITEAAVSLPAGQDAAYREAVDEVKKAGFPVIELSLPDYSLFSLVHNIIGSVEASSSAGRYDSIRYGKREPGAKNWNDMYLLSRGAAFGPLIKSYLFQGAYFQFERYSAFEDACRIRARLLEAMRRITLQADFLLLPSGCPDAHGTEELLANVYDQFASTLFANVTGQPALYLPSASGAAGQGFQLAGPRLSDSRLLSLGGCLLTKRRGGD
jgi:aspartyl-tRNA(Asn)/glutamyl-tRNA(Gln) amidotransferase subunit A